MTTLNDILLGVCRYCLKVHRGISTSTGTTQTLIDATYKQANDQFNSGVLFILSGTYANNYKTITDYASTSGTYTFTPVTAGNVASGTLYEAMALMSGANVYDVISAVNQALFELGDIPTFIEYDDDNTLVTVDEQEEYSLPSGVANVRQMWVGSSLTAPYKWRRFTHYTEEGGSLHIPYSYTGYLSEDYPIRLKYYAQHDTLDSASDEVSPHVNKQWLIYAASVNLLRNLGVRGNWGDVKVAFEEAQQKVITLRPLTGEANIMVKGA